MNAKFLSAVKTDDIKLVSQMLNDGFDPSFNDNISIKIASVNGYKDMVKLLIKDPRVDSGVNDNFPIRSASERGHTEVVKLLLSSENTDPSAEDNEAIRRASQNGRYEIVKMLLSDERVNPTDRNHDAIGFASYNRYEDIIKILLDWYSEHDIPINEFINYLRPEYKRYILLYYDVDEIPLNTYNFGIDDNKTDDKEFVDFMLARFVSYPEKRNRFLGLIYSEDNIESNLAETLQSVNIPPPLMNIISRFLM
jgi:hypothetical protein